MAQQNLHTPPCRACMNQFGDDDCLVFQLGRHFTSPTQMSLFPSNTGWAYPIEGNVFKGHAMIFTKNLTSSPPGLFDGRSRTSAIVLQGKFKRPVAVRDMITGPEFPRGLVNLPIRRLLELALKMVTYLVKSKVNITLEGEQCAHYLPVKSAVKALVVSQEGHQPRLEGRTEQGAALYDAIHADTGTKGKSWEFSKSPFHDGTVFDTKHVWTFHLHQHLVDLSSFKMKIVGKIAKYLNGQPLHFMMKERTTGEYVVSFEAWHKDLLGDAWRYYNKHMPAV